MADLITISEAARRLNKAQNRTLLDFLIAQRKIPLTRVGPSLVMDAEGFRELAQAAHEWDNRPRVNERRLKVREPAAAS